MNSNYEEFIRLMGNDVRIIKYLRIFQRDTTFSVLCKAVNDNDFKTVFKAAHTLKGIALNLSLISLADRT